MPPPPPSRPRLHLVLSRLLITLWVLSEAAVGQRTVLVTPRPRYRLAAPEPREDPNSPRIPAFLPHSQRVISLRVLEDSVSSGKLPLEHRGQSQLLPPTTNYRLSDRPIVVTSPIPAFNPQPSTAGDHKLAASQHRFSAPSSVYSHKQAASLLETPSPDYKLAAAEQGFSAPDPSNYKLAASHFETPSSGHSFPTIQPPTSEEHRSTATDSGFSAPDDSNYNKLASDSKLQTAPDHSVSNLLVEPGSEVNVLPSLSVKLEDSRFANPSASRALRLPDYLTPPKYPSVYEEQTVGGQRPKGGSPKPKEHPYPTKKKKRKEKRRKLKVAHKERDGTRTGKETNQLTKFVSKTPGERVEFQLHGQNGPDSYQFGFDTGAGKSRQFRFEEKNGQGHVKGHYGYLDSNGKMQIFNYRADETGYHAEKVETNQI